jgi:uncharacterized membrane protein
VILAFFLLYTIVSQSWQAPPGLGPSVATDVGLLVTVVLCVSIGFWMSFADKEAKNWKRALLVVGLIFGSVVFLFLGVGETFGLMGVELSYPATFNNLSMAGDFLLAIAAILGLGAVLAFILILDKYVAKADLKAEMERHRLPTEGNP